MERIQRLIANFNDSFAVSIFNKNRVNINKSQLESFISILNNLLEDYSKSKQREKEEELHGLLFQAGDYLHSATYIYNLPETPALIEGLKIVDALGLFMRSYYHLVNLTEESKIEKLKETFPLYPRLSQFVQDYIKGNISHSRYLDFCHYLATGKSVNFAFDSIKYSK